MIRYSRFRMKSRRSTGRFAIWSILPALLLLTTPARSDTIILWHSFRGREAHALETIVANFNAQHSDQVAPVRRDPDHFTEEVEAALRSDAGPDILIWAHDKVGPWAEEGLLLRLDERMDTSASDLYLPHCLEALRWKGALMGLPLSFETLLLYYNRSLVPTPPGSTDELIREAKRHTNRSMDRYGLVYDRTNFYYHAAWLHGFGGRVFDDSGRFDVRSEPMRRSLEFARDLVSVHGIAPDTASWDRQMDLFNSGRAAFLISGPWAYGSLAWDRVSIGIASLPILSPAGRYAAPFLGVKGFYVNARSRRPTLAVDAIEHLTGAFSGCLMNVMVGYLPANKEAYTFSALADHPITERYEERLGEAILMPSVPPLANVWRVMMRDAATGHPGCLERVLLEGVSPTNAATEANLRYLSGK